MTEQTTTVPVLGTTAAGRGLCSVHHYGRAADEEAGPGSAAG